MHEDVSSACMAFSVTVPRLAVEACQAIGRAIAHYVFKVSFLR